MRTRKHNIAVGLGLLALLAAVVAASLGAGGAGARPQSPFALPRAQTLYTTGTMWGPYSDLNPNKNWDYVTGTVGLVYETPFRYDPLKDRFIPWLASAGKWTGKTVYTMTVRPNVKWSDGKPLTATDFKYTYTTLKIAEHPQHTLWTTGLQSVTTKGNQVVFRFGGTPNYQEWDFYLYNVPIVPEHVWHSYDSNTIVSGNMADVSKLIGTGPYVYESGLNSTESFTWKKRSGWWATKVYKLDPKPTYIVDFFNGSNAASLGELMNGTVDLSNNFLPGIDQKVGGKIGTYYKTAPYMLPGNTAWLFPNTTKAPLNDKAFRRALATSIDVGKIVKNDYGNIVTKANATGLLPIWDKYIDKSLLKKYGFSYDVAKAKSLLAAAGYKDVNGDGYVENKDGSKLDLSLIVPNGWSDWMTAIQIVASSAKEAGIKITPGYPDYNTLVDDRGHAKYDLVIGNDRQMSNTPWSYYDYLYRLPILDNQTTVNYERFTDQTAWKLVQQLDKTPASNQAAMKSIIGKLQSRFLQDLPAIPLWFNGMWAQYNTSQWTNFPSSTGTGRQTLPAFWRNYFQMTGIDTLANLEPVGGGR
jgi:peptide/nickel transport system substrate-binding protein